jgi:hypothetical protein
MLQTSENTIQVFWETKFATETPTLTISGLLGAQFLGTLETSAQFTCEYPDHVSMNALIRTTHYDPYFVADFDGGHSFGSEDSFGVGDSFEGYGHEPGDEIGTETFAGYACMVASDCFYDGCAYRDRSYHYPDDADADDDTFFEHSCAVASGMSVGVCSFSDPDYSSLLKCPPPVAAWMPMEYQSFDSGVLVLGPCPGLELAWSDAQPFYFTFNVTNGAVDQGPTPVTVALSNQLLHIEETNMARPGKKVKGFSRGSDPPVVRRKSLNVKTIVQSTPLAGARNRIDVTVESSSDVLELDLSIWPLTGATFEAGPNTSVCKGETEWDASNLQGPTIKFKACFLEAVVATTLTFYVTNPAALQQSPDMFIQPSDPIFGGVLTLAKGNPGTFFGIAGFYQPMRIARFEFKTKLISQSTPVSSRVNTLTVT